MNPAQRPEAACHQPAGCHQSAACHQPAGCHQSAGSAADWCRAKEQSPHARLRDLLYARFRSQPQPLLISDTFGIPAASIWANARNWVNLFRDLALQPGDRLALALPRTPAHVMVTLAAWWQKLTVCPVGSADPAWLDRLDARLLIANLEHPHALGADETESPHAAHAWSLRPASSHTPDTALHFPEHDLSMSWTALDQHLRAAPSAAGAGFPGRPGQAEVGGAGFPARLGQAQVEAAGFPARPAMPPPPLRLATAPADTPSDLHTTAHPWHTPAGLLGDLWPALMAAAIIRVEPVAEPAALARAA